MSYFIFNGVSSDELGLMVTKPVIRPTWAVIEKDFTIGGKSQKFHRKTDTYDDQTMTIETFLYNTDIKNLHKIYKSIQGDGTLWLSSAPDEYLNVTAYPPDPQAVAYMSGVFLLKFRVKPFAYSTNPTEIDITGRSDYVKIDNNGTVFSEPEISFISQANQKIIITVNDKNFIVNHPEACTFDSTIYIDCAEQVCYFHRPEDNTTYPCMHFTENDLPLFHIGENYIMYTGDVRNFKINVKERFL
ncbi:MAG: hypothetical protein K2J08_08405 [Ruminococcus sp.]|nr:hypothetical protein [Ruminococcus sp.]